MKSCPKCNRTYSDSTLAFCLKDGSILSAPYDSKDQQPVSSHESAEPPATVAFLAIPQNKPNRLTVRLERDAIFIGDNFSVSFQRTLRIPDDGRVYPLPPGFDNFPIYKVADYQKKVPASWREHGGIFIPMYQKEAMWLQFDAAYWRPNAIKVAIGKINVITGESWHQRFTRGVQDYMVCPDQPWLDGIKAGEGYIRQFVAMPLGMGYTVEGQVSGKEEYGGIQIIVFDPKPGRFPDRKPAPYDGPLKMAVAERASETEMGLAAGGKISQKIYPDKYGVDTWDENTFGRVYIHLVNSAMFSEITGLRPPYTPVSVRTYNENGLPWYELYDESKSDISPSSTLSKVKSTSMIDKLKGYFSREDDTSIEIQEEQIKKIKTPTDRIDDGDW